MPVAVASATVTQKPGESNKFSAALAKLRSELDELLGAAEVNKTLITGKFGELRMLQDSATTDAEKRECSKEFYRVAERAICTKDEETMKFVLDRYFENGVDINQYGKDSKTLLMRALEAGNAAAADELLNYAPSLGLKDSDGNDALSYAILMKNEEDALRLATRIIDKGRLELGKKQINFETNGKYDLNRAIEYAKQHFHDAPEITFDINSRNHRGITNLMLAAELHKSKFFSLLLDKGASLYMQDCDNRTVLMYAVMKKPESKEETDGMNEIVRKVVSCTNPKILKKYLDFKDKNEETALFWSVNAGNLKAAKLLIELGADVNTQNNMQRTPLMKAALSGDLKLVELLVENNADLNITDINGETARRLALDSLKSNSPVSKFLRDHGAELSRA